MTGCSSFGRSTPFAVPASVHVSRETLTLWVHTLTRGSDGCDVGRQTRRLVDMAKSLSRMSSSAQLLMTGVILEGVNLLLCALALVPMADANLATTLLLLFLIVGGLGSSIAVVCALVGLVKFRRFRWANILLLLVSIVTNPLLVLTLYVSAS